MHLRVEDSPSPQDFALPSAITSARTELAKLFAISILSSRDTFEVRRTVKKGSPNSTLWGNQSLQFKHRDYRLSTATWDPQRYPLEAMQLGNSGDTVAAGSEQLTRGMEQGEGFKNHWFPVSARSRKSRIARRRSEVRCTRNPAC